MINRYKLPRIKAIALLYQFTGNLLPEDLLPEDTSLNDIALALVNRWGFDPVTPLSSLTSTSFTDGKNWDSQNSETIEKMLQFTLFAAFYFLLSDAANGSFRANMSFKPMSIIIRDKTEAWPASLRFEFRNYMGEDLTLHYGGEPTEAHIGVFPEYRFSGLAFAQFAADFIAKAEAHTTGKLVAAQDLIEAYPAFQAIPEFHAHEIN